MYLKEERGRGLVTHPHPLVNHRIFAGRKLRFAADGPWQMTSVYFTDQN